MAQDFNKRVIKKILKKIFRGTLSIKKVVAPFTLNWYKNIENRPRIDMPAVNKISPKSPTIAEMIAKPSSIKMPIFSSFFTGMSKAF